MSSSVSYSIDIICYKYWIYAFRSIVFTHIRNDNLNKIIQLHYYIYHPYTHQIEWKQKFNSPVWICCNEIKNQRKFLRKVVRKLFFMCFTLTNRRHTMVYNVRFHNTLSLHESVVHVSIFSGNFFLFHAVVFKFVQILILNNKNGHNKYIHITLCRHRSIPFLITMPFIIFISKMYALYLLCASLFSLQCLFYCQVTSSCWGKSAMWRIICDFCF